MYYLSFEVYLKAIAIEMVVKIYQSFNVYVMQDFLFSMKNPHLHLQPMFQITLGFLFLYILSHCNLRNLGPNIYTLMPFLGKLEKIILPRQESVDLLAFCYQLRLDRIIEKKTMSLLVPDIKFLCFPTIDHHFPFHSLCINFS